MIITFSKDKLPTGDTVLKKELVYEPQGAVLGVTEVVSIKHYARNVYASITWARGKRVRFTLETRDAWAHGSRTAASGRHMRKASWEAHRDVLKALFDLDPDATVRTALATYRGCDDFNRQFPATAHKNFGGTLINPVTIRQTTVL